MSERSWENNRRTSGRATRPSTARVARGRSGAAATTPVPRGSIGLPHDYVTVLTEIKKRIQQVRLRVALAANSPKRRKDGAFTALIEAWKRED